jgi:hypothetical protein
MADDALLWLFDPPATRSAVLARRPPHAPAVTCVVSDRVWDDVVRLLRWASAAGAEDAAVARGACWRLAAGSADLLRRMPALCAEAGQPWSTDPPPLPPPDLPPDERIGWAAHRIAARMRAPGPLPLRSVAAEVDALGEAAVVALASRAWIGGEHP